jgi:hypothetical protein
MKNWSGSKSKFSDQSYALDVWHECLCLLMQYLRGWNANRIKESKTIKREILSRLEQLDENDLGHPKGGDPGRRDINWKQNWNKYTMRRRYYDSRGVLRSGYSWGMPTQGFPYKCQWKEKEEHDLFFRIWV